MMIQCSDTLWEIPPSFKAGMLVPARIYASSRLIESLDEGVVDQITNVAGLPGIVDAAYCMPDGHRGYGFPIGGMAAFDPDEGIISPGGIGFDVNCGMRLIRTGLTIEEVAPQLERLVDRLFISVPSGVGGSGRLHLKPDEFRTMLEDGVGWCLKKGYAETEDVETTEEGGRVPFADASKISEKAVKRGINQVGTLGSGNHYLEIQVVRPEHVINTELAEAFGFTIQNQIAVTIHCGSRGLGHQVATDYLKSFIDVSRRYGIKTTDRELACAPFNSKEGRDYFGAMQCAINMSYVNRQVIFHRVREVFSDVFHRSPADLGIEQVYDVAHNTAMLEVHDTDSGKRELLVHRKGATRAFGPDHPRLPERFRETGQPVIIGGSMETGSYLLAGVESGKQAFCTTAHGSGRTMSRNQARNMHHGKDVQRMMRERGIYVRTASYAGLAEEVGAAYKDIDEVVGSTEKAGLSRRVIKFQPIGNIKG